MSTRPATHPSAGTTRAPRTAVQKAALAVGAVFLVVGVWLYGLFVDSESDANFVAVNNADDWLHLLLGIGMIALGLLTTRRVADRR